MKFLHITIFINTKEDVLNQTFQMITMQLENSMLVNHDFPLLENFMLENFSWSEN